MNFKNIRNFTLVAVAAFLAGRYLVKPVERVKEVVKYVEVEKKKRKTKVVEVKNPDGSERRETTIEEDQTSTKVAEKYKSKKKGVGIGVIALKDLSEFSSKTEFGIVSTIPLFGNVSLVGTVDSTKRVGLGISLEF
jgi:hypothetical protein